MKNRTKNSVLFVLTLVVVCAFLMIMVSCGSAKSNETHDDALLTNQAQITGILGDISNLLINQDNNIISFDVDNAVTYIQTSQFQLSEQNASITFYEDENATVLCGGTVDLAQGNNVFYAVVSAGTNSATYQIVINREQDTVQHEHTYYDAWTYDDTNHWHAASCEHGNEKSNIEPHSFDAGVILVDPDEENEGTMVFTCSKCGCKKETSIPKLIASEGLMFKLIDSEDAYKLTGRGEFEGSELIVPSVYNGKKVIQIAESAFENDVQLVTVTLPKTIKEIKNNAFNGCVRIVEVCNNSKLSIEEGSLGFGAVAFYAKKVSNSSLEGRIVLVNNYQVYSDGTNCVLTNYFGRDRVLEIPATVTEINRYAFLGVQGVGSITIPESVNVIGEKAFVGCSQVSTLTVEHEIKHVATNAFEDMDNLQTLNIYGDLANYTKNENVCSLIITGGAVPDLAFSNCSKINSVNFEDGVFRIGEYSFANCNGITELEFPDSVISLEKTSFYNCKNIVSVKYGAGIPAWTNSAGIPAWTNIINSDNIKYLEYKNAYGAVNPNNRYGTFSNISNYSDLTIKTADLTVTIKDGERTNKTIKNNVYYFGNNENPYYSANSNADATTISFEPGCKYVYGDLYYKTCEVIIPDSVENCYFGINNYDNTYAIGTSKAMRYNAKDGSRYFGNSNNPYMVLIGTNEETPTNLYIDKNCKIISFLDKSGSGTQDYSKVENIYYNGTLADWCNIAFGYSNNIGSNNTKLYISGELLEGDIIIPNGVEKLNYGVFHNVKIDLLSIPESLTTIEEKVFENTPKVITVDENNTKFKCIDGLLYDVEAKELIVAQSELSGVVKIEEGTLTIRDSALYSVAYGRASASSTRVEQIVFPNSLRVIGASNIRTTGRRNAIATLSYIPQGTIVNDNSTKVYADYAITAGILIPHEQSEYMRQALDVGLSMLEEGGINYYGNEGNPYLIAYNLVSKTVTNIEVNNRCKYISAEAFSSSSTLEQVVLPEGLISIGNSAFSSCKALKEIVIPNSVQLLGTGLFSYCSSLTDVTIPDHITEIPDKAFYSCSKITTIKLPSNLIKIGKEAFSGIGLTTIDIPNSVKIIRESAFKYSKLKSIVIGRDSNLQILEREVFYQCSSLETAEINSKYPLYVGNSLFSQCASLKSVRFGNNVVEIGDAICYKCKALESVSLPKSLQHLHEYAFDECNKLSLMSYDGTTYELRNVQFDFMGFFLTKLTQIRCTNGYVSVKYSGQVQN